MTDFFVGPGDTYIRRPGVSRPITPLDRLDAVIKRSREIERRR